jgi:hypothetical protein
MAPIIIGVLVIWAGINIMLFGIIRQFEKCVITEKDEVVVTFKRDAFKNMEAGFHLLSNSRTSEGKKFYAWGIVEKGVSKDGM